MLTWLHEKNGDRGLDGYVVDKCISIAYDFLQARKKLDSSAIADLLPRET